MMLSYGIIYFILPRYILKNRYWPGIGGILLLIVFAALMSPLLQKLCIIPLREAYHLPVPARTNVFQSFMGGLRGSMTVAGFAVAIKLVKHWYFKKAENEILEKEKLKAELQLLKGQLQPHFIFNTLNSIYSLSIKKSDLAADAILKLSNLLRYMLTECNDMTIPLTKEVQIINNYIELGKSRLRERLDLTINISGDFENKKIAPLLLLPFLENSFKYGAHEMLNSAWISLDLFVKADLLKFKLINGRSSDNQVSTVSSHIGLQNVKKRLELMYPSAHELRITENAETFIVQLALQLDKIKIPESDEQVKLPFSR
jgi:LytS/YehU family sensor histidine kinase